MSVDYADTPSLRDCSVESLQKLEHVATLEEWEQVLGMVRDERQTRMG